MIVGLHLSVRIDVADFIPCYISECKMEVKLSEEFGRKITANQEKISFCPYQVMLFFSFILISFICSGLLFQLAAWIIVTTRAVCHDDPYGWR